MIAIKNMKMPSCCGKCPITYKDYVGYRICPIIGKNIDYGYSDDIHPDCPLVEIVTCKDCKHWKDSDGVYRRGIGAESICPINLKEVHDGIFYCGNGERRE